MQPLDNSNSSASVPVNPILADWRVREAKDEAASRLLSCEGGKKRPRNADPTRLDCDTLLIANSRLMTCRGIRGSLLLRPLRCRSYPAPNPGDASIRSRFAVGFASISGLKNPRSFLPSFRFGLRCILIHVLLLRHAQL